MIFIAQSLHITGQRAGFGAFPFKGSGVINADRDGTQQKVTKVPPNGYLRHASRTQRIADGCGNGFGALQYPPEKRAYTAFFVLGAFLLFCLYSIAYAAAAAKAQ
jgi:hypothetical protein